MKADTYFLCLTERVLSPVCPLFVFLVSNVSSGDQQVVITELGRVSPLTPSSLGRYYRFSLCTKPESLNKYMLYKIPEHARGALHYGYLLCLTFFDISIYSVYSYSHGDLNLMYGT